MDHMVRLETGKKEAKTSQHFFDLKTAYETTSKFYIMKNLQNLRVKGRLPYFIKNFLVGISESESDQSSQISIIKKSISQESKLSMTFFNLKINNITKCPNRGISDYLYVDDFYITSRF